MNQENYISNLSQFDSFLKEQEELACSKKYIFRGHKSDKYILQPSAYRKSEIEKSWGKYPLNKTQIRIKWFECYELLRYVAQLAGLPKKLTVKNYKKASLTHKGHSIPLERVFWLYVDIMRYNHDLYVFHQENKSYISKEDFERINSYPQNYWTTKTTFKHLLISIEYLLEIQLLEGPEKGLIKGGVIFPDITGFDESFPQHYGVSTSVLDWSYDLYVALFFAVRNLVYIPNTVPSPIISVYTYCQIDSSESAVVKIRDRHAFVNNKRAERQKGTFTYLPRSNSFYLIHGRHPSMEDYLSENGKAFELKKYNILLNQDIYAHIQNCLNERGYNEQYLISDVI